MSSYTTQLRVIVEQPSQDDPTLSTSERIEIGRKELFNFDYPIFDPNYKKIFETHFIRNFYMREIGFETEGLFKFQLETWLTINMPYFNKLFESELIKFDPLTNSKADATHTKTIKRDSDTTTQSNSDSTSNGSIIDDNFSRQLDSNNPDSRLTITTNDGQGVIEYASSIDENTENNKQTSSSSDNSNANVSSELEFNETEDYVQSRVGKIGVQTYSKMLTEYRESFIRIENKIFGEMQQLFMLVY